MEQIIAHVNGFRRFGHFSYSLNKPLKLSRSAKWQRLRGPT